MPSKDRLAKVLKADLADAGIPYVDDSGRYADFHSLRHTTGSLLAASGVHPKVAQSIMRHSDINLTLGRYSHVFKGQESDAVAGLPDLSQPSIEKQRAAKTGTDDTEKSLDESRRNRRTITAKMDGNGQLEGSSGESKSQRETDIEGEKRGFSAENGEKRRGRDSNPRYRLIPVRRFSKPLP